MNNLTKEEELILRILKRSLSGQGHLAEKNPGRIEWNRVLILAEEHEIMSLLYPAMPAETPKEILDVLRLRARQTVQKYYRIFFLMKQYVSVLEDAAIPVSVLKGVSSSLPYPVPEYRWVSELGLFVPSEKDFARAEELLIQNGLFRDPMQTRKRGALFHHPEGISVELHYSLMERAEDERKNERLKELTEELREHIAGRNFLGMRIPVLDTPYQAFALLLHMWQHYLHEGFSLRLLCDWTTFWEQKGIVEADLQQYLLLIKDFKLTRFSEFITAVCTEELGLPAGRVHPHLARSKTAYRAFLKDVFETGELGDEAGRMAMLSGMGPGDTFLELHHRMRIRYPKASGFFFCWPPLWIATLMKNRKENREADF